MQIIESLKKKNRTLLEMHIGLLFWGLVCQGVGLIWAADRVVYAKSLWFGIAFAMVNAVHMYRTLDRALDYGEKEASKIIFRGYLIRYVLVVGFLFIIMYTRVLNPLVVFLAYMGLKVTALIQPITHKLCNKIFHETDPIPEPLAEEVSEEEETLPEKL